MNNASGLPFLLILLGLTGFTVTEPILSILGKNPEIFLFYNVESSALIVAFALIIAVLPALLLWLISRLTHAILPRVAQLVDHAIVALLAALWFLQLAKWSLGLDSLAALLAITLAGSGLYLTLYMRIPAVRSLSEFAAFGPLVLCSLFLFSSETGQLTQSRDSAPLPSTGNARNISVLFLILDEFPTLGLLNKERRLDTARYPNLGRLSQEANWYRNFTVQASRTANSVPSLLTGNLPQSGKPTSQNYPNNIFRLLAPSHNLVAFEANTGLCALPKCTEGSPEKGDIRPEPQLYQLLQKTYALWLQRISPTGERAADMTVFQETMIPASVEAPAKPKEPKKGMGILGVLPEWGVHVAGVKPKRLHDFTQTLTPTENPTFYFLHLELPHVPWRFWDTGEIYDLPANRPPIVPENDDGGAWMSSISEYRFTLQAKYTDRLLGEIMDRMKALRMWDDMMVVVVSDHGRSFRQDTSGREFDTTTLDTLAYALLFIKQPGQTSGITDDSNLMSMDLLPTIAAELDIDIPWEIDGLPASHKDIAARGDKKVYRPVVSGNWVVKLGKPKTYDGKKHLPRYARRYIGAAPGGNADDDVLQRLNERLDLERYLGQPVAEFESTAGGAAVVEQLEELQRPEKGKAPLGAVVGNLTSKPSGDRILVAINGRFVTASPLIQFKGIDQSFVAMLPPGALQANNDIELFLVDGSTLMAIEKLTSAQ